MFRHDCVPYRIETSRTVIRCWSPRDAPIMQDAVSESVDSLLPWLPWATGEPKDFHSKISTLRFFRGSFDLGNDYVYGIFDRDETIVLGGCGLHTRVGKYSLEIGYWIRSSFHNNGYATEVTKALIKTAFELTEIDSIRIYCDVRNTASRRVIEKVGFMQEGVLRHRQKDANGDFADYVESVLLRDDYEKSNISGDPISFFDVVGEEIALRN